MERHILHFHVPCFQISLERVCDPRLRYRPVVVAPPHGGIISCSPEARKEGIRCGMTVKEAKRLCPGLIALMPDPRKVEEGVVGLCPVAERYTPLWEVPRPGHIYLDLTGTQRLWGRAVDIGWRLMREIKDSMGLMGSAGLGSNKLVSQVASRVAPPLKALEVRHGEEGPFMGPLDIGHVPAILPSEVPFLKGDLCLRRAMDLWPLDTAMLKVLFGPRGGLVYQQVRGVDLTPVYPQHKMPVVEERVVLGEEGHLEVLRSHLFLLLERCLERLQALGLRARRGGLFIRYSDHVEAGRYFWVKTQGLWPLFQALEGLFLKTVTRKAGIREMRLYFKCVPGLREQGQLFHALSMGQNRIVSRAVEGAVREIRKRFGKGAITYGIALNAGLQ